MGVISQTSHIYSRKYKGEDPVPTVQLSSPFLIFSKLHVKTFMQASPCCLGIVRGQHSPKDSFYAFILFWGCKRIQLNELCCASWPQAREQLYSHFIYPSGYNHQFLEQNRWEYVMDSRIPPEFFGWAQKRHDFLKPTTRRKRRLSGKVRTEAGPLSCMLYM